ncbi:unnamed protein product [Withania somnifera]
MVDNYFTESFNSWIMEPRGKPILKMHEGLKVNIMNRLKEKENEVSRWKDNFSPKCMELFTAYKRISQLCTAMEYQNIKPETEISQWYSKETSLKTYRAKLLLVKGENFWNVLPPHAMDPPDMVKTVGRVKTKRTREKDAAVQDDDQDDMYDINSSASQPTQEEEYHFMPTPGLPQQQYEPFGPARKPESDPTLRRRTVPEDMTSLLVRQTPRSSSRSRLIGFRGDQNGVSEPADLLYSPTKLTWKGKEAVTSNQLEREREKKLGKLKAKKAKIPNLICCD